MSTKIYQLLLSCPTFTNTQKSCPTSPFYDFAALIKSKGLFQKYKGLLKEILFIYEVKELFPL